MAFCNSCGNTLMPGAQFCNKCGANIGGPSPATAPPSGFTPVVTPAATPVPAAPAPTGGGSGALKIILIIVAVIVVIGILGIVSLGLFIRHVAKNSRVHQEGDRVKIETPFGNVDTTGDPAQIAKDMGIDVYPGAEVQKNGSAVTTFGNVQTATAIFTSSDSVDKVCAFYKSRVPSAMVSTSDQNRCTYVSNEQKNMLTINVEASGDNTKIEITSVKKKE